MAPAQFPGDADREVDDVEGSESHLRPSSRRNFLSLDAGVVQRPGQGSRASRSTSSHPARREGESLRVRGLAASAGRALSAGRPEGHPACRAAAVPWTARGFPDEGGANADGSAVRV
jgi:hypothetical protein